MECPVCPIIRNHENEVKSILEKAVKNRPEINVAPFRLGFTSTPICKIKTPVGDDPLSLDDIERMFTKNFPSWNQDFLCFPEGPMFYDKLFRKEPYTRAMYIRCECKLVVIFFYAKYDWKYLRGQLKIASLQD